MPHMTMREYRQHMNDHDGWCTSCEDWTRGECEPDAREYDCPDCGMNTVYGAEELSIMELVTIVDEEE